MKILTLFLNNEMRTGGHRRLLELCEDMAKKGHEVFVLLNDDLNYKADYFSDIRVHCPYVRGKGGSLSTRFKKVVKAKSSIILAKKPDLVLIFGETHLKAALYLKQRFFIPLAYAQRSVPVLENRVALKEKGLSLKTKVRKYAEIWVYRNYERLISRNAKFILFQNRFDEQDFLGRNPKSKGKTHIIPGNIGEPRYKSKYSEINKSTSCRNLIFVGNLWSRKGIRYLIDALYHLHSDGISNIHLDILGPGDWAPWKKIIEETGISGLVTYHGKVSDPFPFIGNADLMIVPSTFDSFPNSVLEALHTGTPVIGSHTGGIPEILKHSELLFPVQNGQAIAAHIKKCINSTDYYLHIKNLCMSRTAEFKFDWTQKWIDVFSAEIIEK